MSVAQKANKLLPQVIAMNKQISKDIGTKFKASKIFSELDKRASDNFMQFVRESSTRAIRIKSGNLLQSILNKSINSYTSNAIDIINNPYYSSLLPLTEEANKLKNHATSSPIKNSLEILNDLKKQNEPIFVVEKPHKEEAKKDEVRYSLPLDVRKKNSQMVLNTIEEDSQAQSFNVKNYLNKVKGLKEKDPYQLKSRLNSIKMPLNVQMLSYKKPFVAPKEDSFKLQDESKDIFDLKYLFKFTKRGVQTEKASLKQGKTLLSSKSLVEVKDKRKIPIARTSKRNILSEKSFTNTGLLVLKEAFKKYSIRDMFDHKKSTLHELVECELPKFEHYDKLIKSKITNAALKKQNKAKIKNKSMEEVRSYLDEGQSRRFAYMSLIEGVKEETVDKEDTKEDLSRSPQFNKRYCPRFCDGYSLRDGETNRINRSLSKILCNDSSHRDINEKILRECKRVEMNKMKQRELQGRSCEVESKDVIERKIRDKKMNEFLSKSDSLSEVTKNETEPILNQEMSLNTIFNHNRRGRRSPSSRYYHDEDISLDNFGEYLYFKHLVQRKERVVY